MMNTFIDKAYELYENKEWDLAYDIIMKEEGYKNNPLALNLLGSIHWKLGDKKEAKKNYLLATKCKNDFWPAYFNLGNLYHEGNKLNKAIIYYIRALNYKGNHFEVLYNIGTCYLKKKEFEKAIYYLRKAIEHKPHHLPSNINLAKAYYLNKNYRKGFIYYNTSLALDKDNNNAKKGYEQCWEKLTNPPRKI